MAEAEQFQGRVQDARMDPDAQWTAQITLTQSLAEPARQLNAEGTVDTDTEINNAFTSTHTHQNEALTLWL